MVGTGQTVRSDRFVSTPDNWAPSYPGDTVRAFVLCRDTYVMIGFWGQDDMGYERVWHFQDPDDARAWYAIKAQWLWSLESISVAQLIKMGFEHA